jgi:hypothetical protein
MKLLETPALADDILSKQTLRVFLAKRKLVVVASGFDTKDGEAELAYVIADAMRHIEAAARSNGSGQTASDIFASFETRIKALIKRKLL